MDPHKMETELNLFLRECTARQFLLKACIPCITNVIIDWCGSQKSRIGDNIDLVQKEMEWKAAIESQVYPSSNEVNISWSDITISELHNKPVEVAKVFALSTRKSTASEIGDLDMSSVLNIMMHFREIHQGDPACYNLIKEIQTLHFNAMKMHKASEQSRTQLEVIIVELVKSLAEKHQQYLPPSVKTFQTQISKVLTDPESVPYMPVLGASYLIGIQMRPHLTKIFLKWHEEQKLMLKPCSAPQKCSSKPASGTKGTPCKNCKSWVRALRKAYSNMGEEQQPFEDVVDTTRLHTDPVEAMKAFLPKVAGSLTHLDDLDAESTWFLLKRFSPILKKSHKVVQLITNLFAEDCKLFHVSVNGAGIEEKLINDTFKTYRDLLTTLHETHPKLFTQEWEDNLASHLDQIQHLKLEGYDIDIKDLVFEDVTLDEKYQKACYKKPTGERIEVSVKRLSSVDKESLCLMKNLKHKNIVQLVGVCHDEHSTYIVTEYAEKGDLGSYLRIEGAPPPALALKWSKEACAALDYLHSIECVHTDIRPSNFLIMSDDSLKLSSLELVTEWDQTKSHRGTDRTCAYMAPEVIENQFRSMKSDIFSVGMILWVLITGKFPYINQKGEYNRMNAICRGERPPMPDNCPPKLTSMLEGCWKKAYKERPSAESLAQEIEGAIKEYFGAQEQPKKEKTAVEDTEDEDNNSATGFQGKPEVSVKVQYKSNTGHSAMGLMETLHAILGFLNSAEAGIVHLLVDPKEKNDDPQDFDRELYDLLAPQGQGNSYLIHGSHGEERYISTKPITQMRILAKSNAYRRDETGIREINDTTELIKTFQLETDEALPSLPEEFWFLESVQENALYEFKDSSGKEFLTCFNNTSVHKYVSAFANSCGGRILFGINDTGIVSGVSGTEKKQEITDAVTKKMKELIWFHRNEGCIEPVENKHWMLRFVDVNGTPPGPRLRVAALSVRAFNNGLVFTDSPQCPVWDPKAKVGYRNLTFAEWCSDLKEIDLADSGESKKPEDLSDDDDLEADFAVVRPSVMTTLGTDSAVVKPLMTSATVDDDSDDLEADSAVVKPSLVTSIGTDSAVVKRPLVTSATSSLETDSVVARHRVQTPSVSSRHTSSTGTQASADVPGMTVLPESTEDRKSRSVHLAKKEYMLKTYRVPKEAPTDVDICFTSAPVSEGLQFSSGQIAGALPESSSVKGQRGGIKSDVSIRVKKYVGPMHITVHLVSEEDANCLHPNRLVGTDCQHGIYSKHVIIKSPGQTIRLPNIHISRVARKDVGVELDQRKEYIEQLCPRTTFQTRKSEEYDLSRVKLCVLGYLPDDTKADEYTIPLHPITSITLCDKGKQVRKEPRIVKISQTKGPVGGGEKIKLVVVWTKDEFDVMFSLNITDPPSSWQTIADVTESVNQKGRRLVTVRTPAFHKKDITLPTQVSVQVRSGGLNSNALPYTFMPKTDNSVDIKKKVDKRRPVYITHFTDVGAARPDVLEYDEKESRMGLSKRKWKPNTNEDAPHSTENLLAVTKRLPTVIPARPLPKPKQTGSAATSGARPKDSSDGASSNDTSEMLRKYKAFASTHGYKKTAQRVEDVKTHYIDSVAEEEQLPPAEEETKELYVSDWVTTTLPATKKKPEEVTPENEAQKKADDAEMKAIALGIDQTSTAKSEDPAIKVQGPDQTGGAHVMEQSSTDGSYNTASGDDKKDEYVNNWVTSTIQGTEDSQKGAAAQEVEEKTGEKQEMEQLQVAEQRSSEGSFKTADSGSSGSEQMIAAYMRQLQEKDDSDVDSNAPTGDRSSSSGTMSMDGDQTDLTGLDGKANNEEASAEEPATLVQQGSEGSDVLLNDVEWGEVLGKGNYGRVHRVVWNGKHGVATKSTTGTNVRKLKQLNNPHIVATLGLYYWSAESAEPQEPYIVTEYMQQGSLKQALRDAPKLTLRSRMSLALQAAHGFAFLHSKGIAHGDVGTQNCFLQEDDKLKVQLLELHGGNSKSADVEMFGNLLVEVLFAHKAYETQTGAGSRPEIPSSCPADLRELIQSCWNESAMQSLTDVDGKLDRLTSKWPSKDGWKDFEDLDELECDVPGTSDENLHPGPTIKITRTRDASSASSSAVHVSDQSQYPMKAIADLIVSGNSTPESGTFDAESPFYGQSPNSTQQPENLKTTMTSDYNSPSSTRLFKEQEIEHVSAALGNQELGLTDQDEHEDGSANLDKTRQLGEEPEAQNIYDHPISERKYQSLPAETSSPPMNTSEHLSMDNSQFVGARETQQKARRVKLTPPRVTKEVGANGGTLTLEDLGIEMHIPSGALEKAVPITLTVVWDEDFPRPQLGKKECNVCPVVRCLPSGLHFHKPVTVRIPHCAVIPSDKKKVNAKVHWNENDEGQDPDWQTNTEAEVEVKDDHLLLSMTHFCDPCVTLDGIECKKLKLEAHISKMKQVHQEIHVYVHNDHPEARERIKAEQEALGGRKRNGLSPTFFLKKSEKDLTVVLNLRPCVKFPSLKWELQTDHKKILKYFNLWYDAVTSCQFTLERISGNNRLVCTIQAHQEGNPEQKAEIEIAQECPEPVTTSARQQSQNCPEREASTSQQQSQEHQAPITLQQRPASAPLQHSPEYQAAAAAQRQCWDQSVPASLQQFQEHPTSTPQQQFLGSQPATQQHFQDHTAASPNPMQQFQKYTPLTPQQRPASAQQQEFHDHSAPTLRHPTSAPHQQLQGSQTAAAVRPKCQDGRVSMPLEQQSLGSQATTQQQFLDHTAATPVQQVQRYPPSTPQQPPALALQQQLLYHSPPTPRQLFQDHSAASHMQLYQERPEPTPLQFQECQATAAALPKFQERPTSIPLDQQFLGSQVATQQQFQDHTASTPQQQLQECQATANVHPKYQKHPASIPLDHQYLGSQAATQQQLQYHSAVTPMQQYKECPAPKQQLQRYQATAAAPPKFQSECPASAPMQQCQGSQAPAAASQQFQNHSAASRRQFYEHPDQRGGTIDQQQYQVQGNVVVKNQGTQITAYRRTASFQSMFIDTTSGQSKSFDSSTLSDVSPGQLQPLQPCLKQETQPPGQLVLLSDSQSPVFSPFPNFTSHPKYVADTGSMQNWLPFRLELEICSMLDPEDPRGFDYRMLADRFNVNYKYFTGQQKPTESILNHLRRQKLINNKDELIKAFEDISRPDVADMAKEFFEKKSKMDESQQIAAHSPPTTGGTPAIQAAAGNEQVHVIATHRGTLAIKDVAGNKQAMADQMLSLQLGSQQMNGTLQQSPPLGTSNQTSILMMTTPPAATTPGQSPGTPGSGQATIPAEYAAIDPGAATNTQTGNSGDDVDSDLQAYGFINTPRRIRRNSGEE